MEDDEEIDMDKGSDVSFEEFDDNLNVNEMMEEK